GSSAVRFRVTKWGGCGGFLSAHSSGGKHGYCFSSPQHRDPVLCASAVPLFLGNGWRVVTLWCPVDEEFYLAWSETAMEGDRERRCESRFVYVSTAFWFRRTVGHVGRHALL
ncbi:unnamed protein product, partial [Ectocarpus sp. 8 AP-2014]